MWIIIQIEQLQSGYRAWYRGSCWYSLNTTSDTFYFTVFKNKKAAEQSAENCFNPNLFVISVEEFNEWSKTLFVVNCNGIPAIPRLQNEADN